ncbi:pentapeptide repeat-containing protein [Amycolatopsis rhabdoformis]|uniref:Pentapeptide repeat-containing protein n=1 Tax=Amycolatopsis rhabdoformis TaxID=1448059 RepID=A0ABZ1HW87_9PSEU|nr:pentapeptide repeat-containing protein [Amycolatopsis rhabdoformis]WSE26497.1 pentapeptide repeat-containing protein [Amycolatopsis rhabdoformis]
MTILEQPEDQCSGVQVSGLARCLAHLNSAELGSFLRHLSPGAELDVRGTTLDPALLRHLKDALTPSGVRGARTRVGHAQFNGTTFTGEADFRDTTFAEDADFSGATFAVALFARSTFAGNVRFFLTSFTEGAGFVGTTFKQRADFTRATFSQRADFKGTTFTWSGRFTSATFMGDVYFDSMLGAATTFAEDADFSGATFTSAASFCDTAFVQHARFSGATFTNSKRLGPLTAGRLDLRGAQFGGAVVIEAEAGEVSCRGTRFAGGVELRIRRGRVDLADAFLGAVSSLAPSATKSTGCQATDLEYVPAHRPVLTFLSGTDVSELALTDVDLHWCRFAGAHHLDKLRIEGDSPFPRQPRVWWRSSRQVLFDEHLWRARRAPRSGWLASDPRDSPEGRIEQVGPDRLAALYRSLRKALEDGKNEAGAGDFYFGEQEARRRAINTSAVERGVLLTYWLASGYGQRASRAISALIGLVAVVTILLVSFGLAAPGPVSQSTTATRATLGGGQETVTIVDDIPPKLPATGARWAWDRVDTSARIALGAVVFRDTSQKLTTAGTWTVMFARFAGPILLTLAALAVRARVKR